MKPLSIDKFKELMKGDVIILDTRSPEVFTQAFVPGSIFIGLEGRFSEWATQLLSFTKRIILVTEAGQETATIKMLEKTGFSNIDGWLEGGISTWLEAGETIDMIIDVEADELAMDIPHDPNLLVVDVRLATEFADGHVKSAVNMPLGEMNDLALIADFEENQQLYVHCGGGYRSVIACSILKAHGIHNLRNIVGGWDKIKEESRIKISKEPSVLN